MNKPSDIKVDTLASAFVVMSNDYPAAVFADEAEAEAFCDAKRREQREKLGRTRVNWRAYGLKIGDTEDADRFHQSILSAGAY